MTAPAADEDQDEYLDRLRDEYTFGDFWKVDGSGNRRCGQCRDLVETWTESVPCCGGGHGCTDTLYVHVCHRCRLIGDSW